MSEQWILPGLPDQGQKVELPSGGGDFVPTGFIGQWMATLAHRIYVECDSDEALRISKSTGCVLHNTTKNGAFFFFDTAEHAKAVMDEHGIKYSNFVWHLEAQKDRLFWYSEESKEKFNWDPIGGDVNVKTLGSRKYRHEFHLIALPSAVAAVARFFGKDLHFDISPLLAEGVQDEEFFALMCGDPDAKKTDLKEFNSVLNAQTEKGIPFAAALSSARSTESIPMEYSVLWRQRETLWKELGEPDARKYTVNQDGEDTKDGEKTDTTAPYLSAAVGIVQPWTEARWMKVRLVPDPRVDATNDDGKRFSIPVIVDYYHNEAEAKAAFESTRAQADEDTTSGEPAIPEAWAGFTGSQFADVLREQWGKAPPLFEKAMGCSVEECQEWATFLGLQ